jgi:hypothetical protein
MPAAIIRGAQGAPGTIGYENGLTSSVFNELNFVIPKYDAMLKKKFGNSYTIMSELLGNAVVKEDMTTTNTFSHFEVGRYLGVVLVNANVTGVASGANVTFVAKSPESYNNGATGTESPIAEGQTVRIRSNGVKGNVVSVTRTAGAWSIVVSPLGSTFFRTGTSGTQLNAGEGIEIFGGTQLAGEASTAGKTIKPKLYRYDNTATTLRSDYEVTDFASMQQTQVDFGGGDMYIEKLAVDNMNISMLKKLDDAFFEGVPYANTTSIGTIGVIPEVESRGGEVNYLTGSAYGIADFQRITRVIDWNGGPDEYHMLQDIYQRQAMNTSLFGLYPNGMINYGSVGFGADAAVTYGFKSFSTDTVSFHFHRAKPFGAEADFGYTPTQGDFRANYGLCVPQGKLRDVKTGETYPYMQQVYKKHPRINNMGSNKIYAWGEGFTLGTKTAKASDNFHQICYFGSRVVSAEQFIINKGVAA